MKKIIILLAFFLNTNLILFGQTTVNIKLELSTMSKEIPSVSTPILFYKDIDKYKGIEFTMDSLWVGRVVLNREQYWFDQSKLHDSLNQYYLDRLSEFDIDIQKLSNVPLKTYIPVLIKIKNGKKIMIVDSNNNHDFSDDDVNIFTFKTNKLFLDNYENSNTFRVNYEKLLDNKIKSLYLDIKIKPLDPAYKYQNKVDSIRAVYFKPFSYLQGNLTLESENFVISISKNSRIGFTDKPNYFTYSVVPENHKIQYFDWVKFNQKFKIKKYILQIVEFSAENQTVSITIRPATNTDFGWNIGDYIPENILNEYFPSDYKKKNLNIANFWGSWCSSCIQEIPDIIKLNKNNLELINLVNIACENNQEGINKAKEIVANKKMDWKQVYTTVDGVNSLNKLLNVTTFPTIIVFDHRGMIISREVGLGNIDTIKEKLKLN